MIDLSVKQAIVNEYLVGGTSCRKLGAKYGVSYRTVSRLMQEFYRLNDDATIEIINLQAMKENTGPQDHLSQAVKIRELEKQLEQERLHNKLLTAIIDIAEEELHIPIRKKYGTRQCKK